jgi:hypothetical protein
MTRTDSSSGLVPDGGDARPGPPPARFTTSRSDVVWLAVVLVIGLGARLLFVQWGPQAPIWADQSNYHLCGRYQAGFIAPTEGVVKRVSDYVSTRGPGYPLFLAAIFRFIADDVAVVRYIQAVMSALVCGLVFVLARRIASRSVAVLAVLLVGVYPTLVVFPGRLLSENLAIPLFYLALALLVHAVYRRSLVWLLLAGIGAAGAGLSRSTFLPVLPFLVLSGFLALQGVSWARRLFLAGAYAATIAMLMLGWRFLGPQPATGGQLVGARGVQVIVDGFKLPTHPHFRGWSPDPGPPEGYGEPWWQDSSAGRIVAAVVDLPFSHLWYPDTSWLGAYFVPHGAFRVAHRALIILAIGGFALSLAWWRSWLPLLLPCVPIGVTWVKWVELRHALPAIPLMCIFAAFFALTITACVFRGQAVRKKVAVVLGGAVVTAAALRLTQPLVLANLAPATHPLTLGDIHDAVILTLPFGWAAVVMWLVRSRLGLTRAVLAGPVPAALFSVLFAAHMVTASEPRWHRWTINLAGTHAPIVQEIELPKALALDEIRSASWLVDLTHSTDTPALRIGVNGTWLPAEASQSKCRPLVLETASLQRQDIYKGVSKFVCRELSSWAQWWGVSVDPSAVAGRKTVSCMLAYEQPAPNRSHGGALYLGGGLSARSDNATYVPALRGSIYRWPVLEDWRFHELRTLASVRTRGYFSSDGSVTGRISHVSTVPRALPRLLDAGFAQANIRLLIKFKDGRSQLY